MEKILRIAMFVFGLVLVVLSIQTIVTTKFTGLKASTLSDSDKVVTAKTRERQLDCLAKNIYYEAGNESFEGKVAVAQVTMNRSESGRFPTDICAVVYQKTVFIEKVVCQFSWYCLNRGSLSVRSPESYDESYAVAKKVLLEGFRLDMLKTAMYYHADYVNPNWGKEKVGKIGHHIFYKENKL